MRILTYTITKGDFSVTTTNLEQAKQYSNQLGVPYEITLVTPRTKSNYNEKRIAAIRAKAQAQKNGERKFPNFFLIQVLTNV